MYYFNRSEINLVSNDVEHSINTPDTEVQIDKCLPAFVEKWTGHKVCLQGTHQVSVTNVTLCLEINIVTHKLELNYTTSA